jgi:hypothetical protein
MWRRLSVCNLHFFWISVGVWLASSIVFFRWESNQVFRVAYYLALAATPVFSSHILPAQNLTLGGTAKQEPSAVASNGPPLSNEKASHELAQKQMLAPLTENEHYFSAPVEDKTVLNTAKGPSADQNRPHVRLLGIGRVGKLETDETHAILKIKDRQLYGRIGDSLGEIEVVDIGRRFVTLQSGRERWTIELFEQPIVNEFSKTSSALVATQQNSKRPSRRPSVASSVPKMVSVEPTVPSPQSPSESSTAPMLEVPKLPDLELPPPPPDLPEFLELP